MGYSERLCSSGFGWSAALRLTVVRQALPWPYEYGSSGFSSFPLLRIYYLFYSLIKIVQLSKSFKTIKKRYIYYFLIFDKRCSSRKLKQKLTTRRFVSYWQTQPNKTELVLTLTIPPQPSWSINEKTEAQIGRSLAGSTAGPWTKTHGVPLPRLPLLLTSTL